jgi:hypothetical protein
MLLDAAYAVRQVLAELSLSDASLNGVLLHSTGRSPYDKLLAMANACACLGELRHYGFGVGYPGDTGCGLPAFAADVPAFDETRLVHLGERPTEAEFDRAARGVGDFLHAATATPASVFLDRCTSAAPDVSSVPSGATGILPVTVRGSKRSAISEMTLRTFGVAPIDSTAAPPWDAALPRLAACGGRRRLWLMGPADAVESALRQHAAADLSPRPAIVIDSHSAATFGWEIEDISLTSAAAHVIENRRECMELASRLHTRLDVAW